MLSIEHVLNDLNLSPTSKVLDIGCFALGGSNTSIAIVNKFHEHGEIVGLCNVNNVPDQYNIRMIIENYFTFNSTETFDLICLDLGGIEQCYIIENDLSNKLYNMLNENGILLFYTFCNIHYNAFHEIIRQHLKTYWKVNFDQPGKINLMNNQIEDIMVNKLGHLYKFINVYDEPSSNSRGYLKWIVLQKSNIK